MRLLLFFFAVSFSHDVVVNRVGKLAVELEFFCENNKRYCNQYCRYSETNQADCRFRCVVEHPAVVNLVGIINNRKSAEKEYCLNGVCHFLQKAFH